MSELYYSQRQKQLRQSPNPKIGLDFWVAYHTYINRLLNNEYFCKEFPAYCGGNYPCGYDNESIASRLREEMGRINWPLLGEIAPESEQILDLLAFFYRFMAKPIEWLNCSSCQERHPDKYDVTQARYEYTVDVNAMLKRFNHPYKLQVGEVKRKGSEILDSRITSVEFKTQDTHLLKLLQSAFDNFYDKSGKKKFEALRSIVDVFERIKTLENTNKKKSVKKVVSNLSPIDDICSQFDAHLREMTKLANKYTIRHHESGAIVLNDEELIDYLFYSYYNLIHLILKKYNLIK